MDFDLAGLVDFDLAGFGFVSSQVRTPSSQEEHAALRIKLLLTPRNGVHCHYCQQGQGGSSLAFNLLPSGNGAHCHTALLHKDNKKYTLM